MPQPRAAHKVLMPPGNAGAVRSSVASPAGLSRSPSYRRREPLGAEGDPPVQRRGRRVPHATAVVQGELGRHAALGRRSRQPQSPKRGGYIARAVVWSGGAAPGVGHGSNDCSFSALLVRRDWAEGRAEVTAHSLAKILMCVSVLRNQALRYA